jgi:hypothetical protein
MLGFRLRDGAGGYYKEVFLPKWLSCIMSKFLAGSVGKNYTYSFQLSLHADVKPEATILFVLSKVHK